MERTSCCKPPTRPPANPFIACAPICHERKIADGRWPDGRLNSQLDRRMCDFAIKNRQFEISDTGFTLIELLVVIAIIAILAAMLLPGSGAAANVRATRRVREQSAPARPRHGNLSRRQRRNFFSTAAGPTDGAASNGGSAGWPAARKASARLICPPAFCFRICMAATCGSVRRPRGTRRSSS